MIAANGMNLPDCLIIRISGVSGNLPYLCTKIIPKEKLAVAEQHVRLNIKEPNCNGSMAEGVE